MAGTAIPKNRRNGCDSNMALLTWILPIVRSTNQQHIPCHSRTWSCKQESNSCIRQFSRRSVLIYLAATVLALPLDDSGAVCGEPDPFFAHFLDWREDFTTYEGRQIHYRIIGSAKKEKKAKKYPIVYLGDAGIAIAGGETLELLGGTDRRILFVDQLGVGESEELEAQPKRQWLDLAADEVIHVLLKSNVTNKKVPTMVHLVAVGFGIQVADVLVKRSIAESTDYQVASVVAEGWSLPRDFRNVSFSAMQGERACAVEGADGGNIDILRTVYGSGNWNPTAALRNISSSVPVMALHMKDWPSLDLRGTKVREKAFDGSGRIPHLAASNDSLGEMENFFDDVEGRSGQK